MTADPLVHLDRVSMRLYAAGDDLMGAVPSLGQHRREALKLAAGFRGEEAVDRGVTEERALETVLEWLSGPRLMDLAVEAVELYVWDRAGSDN